MKSFVIILLAGMLSLGLSSFALAGMNHQPHSVKTFMGKDRKASPDLSQPDRERAEAQEKKIKVNTYRKGPQRVNS